MDPILSAFLRSWEWRIDVLVVLTTAGLLYTVGWWRLRKRTRPAGQQRRGRSGRYPLAARWRPVAYWSGLLLIGLALLSPIDVFGNQLFIMHMVQHLLLVMFAPPLLLIADPLPFLLWGMPAPVRSQASRLLSQRSPFRRFLKAVTKPGIAWMLFITAYWGWHDPKLYNAALSHPLIHDLEHASFFGGAMLFWWRVTGAAPRLHGRFSLAARAAYAMSFVPPNMLAGIAIAFAPEPLYTYYLSVPRLWGITVMQDQQWGGFIMWVPGSMMYIVAALVLLYRLFAREDGQTMTSGEWERGNTLLAPGVRK